MTTQTNAVNSGASAAPTPTGAPQGRAGLDKAAILLLSLGENEAARVMSYLSARQVQAIGAAMMALTEVKRDDVLAVLDEFSALCDKSTSLGVGTSDYLRSVLTNALGADKANSVIDRILGGQVGNSLEAMKWLDARSIAEILRVEHPQIAAMVLSYLERSQAAEVLAAMPANVRSDLTIRIATLSDVQPAALEHLNAVIAEQFSTSLSTKASGLGGLKAAADILNLLEPSKSTEVLKEIASADSKLATNIEELMFVFEDLVGIDDRGFQELLRRLPAKSLALALKAASEELKSKIYRNMSQRAAEMLREDVANMGAVRLADVEAAQKEILMAARQAAEEGVLNLGTASGDEMIE